MILFNRHGPCIGIRLFKSKKRFIQLWYCPRGYTVEPHSHDDQHIELMYLFGKTVFYRKRESKLLPDYLQCFTGIEGFEPSWKNIFKCFTVKPKQLHWFSVSSLPLIFINFATFLEGKEPVSAATDFHKK